MERWVGRVAIVTGASAGIGADIARLLAENGMRVVGVARRVHRVQELAEEMKGCKGEIHAVHGDVTKEEDVLRVVKWTRDTLGGADVLVNNAGIFFHLPLTDFDTTKMRNLMDLNVFGLCLFTREVVKDMRERGVDDGHIFHISRRSEERASRSQEISPGAVRTEIMQASGMSPEVMKSMEHLATTILEPRDVSNALLYALTTPPHVQPKDFDTTKVRNMMDLNVIGLCLFTREVVKDMRERGVDDGHIFHIGSVTGTRMIDRSGTYPYTASKHSVRVLTEGLRRELRDLKTKIRVTEISPGSVRSEILLASGIMTPEELKKGYDSMGTILEPRDVSNALLYALTAPPHVQVHEITMYPTGQYD
ncbi:hypothetical protein B566_EDAN012325 [Ephemera danica]|nr:hypothetical protein B566_EDAN012325 [Ephemera danica]